MKKLKKKKQVKEDPITSKLKLRITFQNTKNMESEEKH